MSAGALPSKTMGPGYLPGFHRTGATTGEVAVGIWSSQRAGRAVALVEPACRCKCLAGRERRRGAGLSWSMMR